VEIMVALFIMALASAMVVMADAVTARCFA
jgi:hypothetical protein